MDDTTPEPEDEQPNDEESADEYRRAAEATLQRLMKFLSAFNIKAPAQTTPADIEDPHLAPGALYSIPGSMPHTFQVIKVLAVDEFGVHVRLYGNAFVRRPAAVAPDLLDTSPFISMAPEDVGQEWPLSVGHLPRARLPHGGDHEGLPHHPQRPPPRRALGADRPRGSRGQLEVAAVGVLPVVVLVQLVGGDVVAFDVDGAHADERGGL